MNCWEVLGIEPTGDHARIRAAYERQEKFASGEELERLRQAFKEATGGNRKRTTVHPMPVMKGGLRLLRPLRQ